MSCAALFDLSLGTLRDVGGHEFRYLSGPVPGRVVEVELTSGPTMRLCSDDGVRYFCHGLTFGGKDAPGGPISPYTGNPVEVILREHYEAIPEVRATAGDVLVWRGIAPLSTPTSRRVDRSGNCLRHEPSGGWVPAPHEERHAARGRCDPEGNQRRIRGVLQCLQKARVPVTRRGRRWRTSSLKSANRPHCGRS